MSDKRKEEARALLEEKMRQHEWVERIRRSPTAKDIARMIAKEEKPVTERDIDIWHASKLVMSGHWCRDGGKCHHECDFRPCFRQRTCEPLTMSLLWLNPDWSWRQPE